MAFLSGWSKRVKFTVKYDGKVDATLTHFPITVFLGTSIGINSEDVSFIFDELGSDANRKKIAVTESDGTTQWYVEIEKWDDGNEVAILHIGRATKTISHTEDTDFYLYYDADHADNTDYVGDANLTDRDGPRENVWDSNFKAVFHLRDETTSSVIDSTSNDKDGTKKGANEPNEVAAKVGEGQDFDGSDDIISVADIAALAHIQTISIWVKSTFSANMNQYYWDEGSNIYQIQLWDADDQDALPKIAFNGVVAPTELVNTNTWYKIDCVANGNDGKTYINGAFADLISISERTPGAITIGDYGGGGYSFDGEMDEIRVSDVERNAAWLKASYNSTNDSLLDWASEEVSYTLIAAVGAFTLTGIAVLLTKTFNIICAVGEFTLTGIAALFTRALKMACAVGTFTLTGIAVTFNIAWKMAVTTGSYVLTGIVALFTKAWKMSVTVGQFTLTGITATIISARSIACSVGSFTLTGIAVALKRGWKMAVTTGTFVLTGITATIISARSMAVTVGSFALTGITSTLKLILKTIPKPIVRIVTTNLSTRITSHKPSIRIKKDNPIIR